jgi:DNA-binding transcriptional LysR family regulator
MQAMHLAGIDLNLALVLHALLHERSVSRAAKRVGLSQSATSHALARLRRILGDPLVTRTPSGVTPTPRALEIADPLANAVRLLERAFAARPVFDPRTESRRFQVAATDYFELVLLPALMTDLDARAPNTHVWVRPMNAEALEAAKRGDLDLVVGVFPGGVEPPLRSRVVLEDELVCIVRKGHALEGKALSLERFVKEKHILIAPRGMPGGPVDTALAERGVSRTIGVAVPHFLAAAHLVAESDLMLTVARRVADVFMRLLPLRVLAPPLALPKTQLVMVWHARHDDDPAHAWLRDRLVRLTPAPTPATRTRKTARSGRRRP